MSSLDPLQPHSGALELQVSGAEKGRLVLQNVNGFTAERAEELKCFVEASSSGGCTIMCLTEMNVDWRSSFTSLKEMTRWRVNRHVMWAHNTTERGGRMFQPGGVAILSFGEAAARIIGTEQDSYGLGRWCAVKFQLKSQTLWVMVVYRPCVAPGVDTVYQQHLRRLRALDDDRDPRSAVLEDVASAVARFREEGSWVIVSGDFNEDVRTVRIQGVREAITRFQCGPTHQRGTVPIDGFFTSFTVPVTGGGISRLYAISTSDHSAVWLDTSVFSKSTIPPLRIRKLNVKDPRTSERYLTYLREHLTQATSDERRVAVMVLAESKCRKVCTGGMQYSPVLSRALLWIRLWNLRLKRAQGKNVDVSVLVRLEQKVEAEDGQEVLGMSLEVIKEGLLTARTTLKKIRTQHSVLRTQHLTSLAEAGSVGIHVLMERERQRAVFRRLREAIPSKTKRPLFMVRDQEGILQDTPASIYSAVVKENRQRFTQTNDTPLRVEPLRGILGDLGETEAADSVLLGTFAYTNVNVDPTFLELLPFLRQSALVQPLDIFLDAEFRKGWSKMQPNIGCQGPLHFGHFIAMATDEELGSQAAAFLRSTFSSGIPAARWLTGTDIMLEKQPGEYRVEKLRTILLMQPDFNFGNKMIGRSMMKQAESLGLLPEAQYGSRKCKSASLQVCNKVLLFEICRMQLIPVGYCSTDAKSNYDRIVHSFAVLAMRRLGVPREVAWCMFRTLQQMHHQVRTGFGVSENSYASNSEDPFQGVGQGNGAGPAIWAAVSAPLFAWMESREQGVKVTSPLSNQHSKISCLAFVDDTDLVFSPPFGGLHTDLREGIQGQLQAWERALRVTGGAIVPEKTFYWSLYFVKDKLQAKSSMPPISVLDSQGELGPVPHLLPDVSMKTLGLLVNPSGDWTDHKRKLRRKMEEWAESCKVSGLSRQDSLVELRARVLPRVLYGVEATSFTRAECKYIMAPLLRVGLQAMGITKNLPRPIVFGPEELLGLDLTDMYVLQGVRHLSLLEAHGPMDPGLTGQLLRCLLEEAVIHVGLPGSLFTQNFNEYGLLLPQGWVKTLWRFCWDYQIELNDWIPHFQTLRENDRFLVREARSVVPKKDSSSLVSFNKCRRYLRVLTMGDIVSGDGTSIRKDAFEGVRNQWCQRPFRFTEAYPSAGDWTVWKGVLRKLLGPGSSLQLSPSRWLGRWFSSVNWQSYTNGAEDVLYLRTTLGWSVHPRVPGSLRQRRFALTGDNVDEIPMSELKRVVVIKYSNGFLGCGAMGAMEPPIDGGSQLPEIFSVRFGSGPLIPANGVLTFCSDGSFKDNRGTASWIAVDGVREIGEDMLVPDGVHNSYRSELGGILGGLRFLDSLSPHLLPSEARFLCDGKSALEVAFGTYPLRPSMDQLDLLQGIRKCRESVQRKGVRLTPVHVKGHADADGTADELTEDQILNIRMDTRAKAFWQHMQEQGWPTVAAPKLIDSCSVRFAQEHTSGHKLHRVISERDLRSYWLESKHIVGEVDWRSLAIASRAVKRGKGVFLTKFFSGFCGVNRWRKKWGLSESDQCQRCELAEETTAHLWVCGVAEAQLIRENAIDQILDWLRSQGGNTGFCRSIRSVLGAIRSQGVLPLHMIPEEYREAFAAQVAMGWDNFLMGCWAVEWRERLRWEYAAMHDRRQPERMVAEIIERLWETSWDLWLGRNASVYPFQMLSAEGELIPVSIVPTRLCRRSRRRKGDSAGRACMARWLSGGR